MWFLQMAQLSTTISQAQSATAFHCNSQIYIQAHVSRVLTFFTSNRFLPSAPASGPVFVVLLTAFLAEPEGPAAVGASDISTSAMISIALRELMDRASTAGSNTGWGLKCQWRTELIGDMKFDYSRLMYDV